MSDTERFIDLIENEIEINKQKMTEILYIRFIAEYYEDHDWFKEEGNYYVPNFELMKKIAKNAAEKFYR